MSKGIRPTMGTLSGADMISQSCRQSISFSRSHVATAALDRRAERSSAGTSTSVLSAPFLYFRFQHHRRWSRDAAILTHAPEVHDHENRSHNRNPNAMPNVGAEQRVSIDDRTAQ